MIDRPLGPSLASDAAALDGQPPVTIQLTSHRPAPASSPNKAGGASRSKDSANMNLDFLAGVLFGLYVIPWVRSRLVRR